MKFSIIVPVYNVAPYLDECLTSLQNQEGKKDYEVICINDGSTDDSRNILTSWEHKWSNLKVIDRKNGGLSAARNTGIDAATGDYVLFVDSDDKIETSMLHRLSTEVDGSDMICFACGRMDNGAYDTLMFEQSNGWDYYNHHALEARKVPFVCVWQRCYRREFLSENNLRFHEGILHEDNEFTPRVCLKAQHIKVIPDVLYHYRVRTGSIMTTHDRKRRESLIIIGNELSELFANEKNIDKTTIYRALTQYYQMAFINSRREEDSLLLSMVNRECHHRVSRTKWRHRINYFLIHTSPALYRQLYKK